MELLRRLTVRGGSGRIFEYGGPGAESLSLPQRATICNMGAELTLTTSVFPSDEATREYFRLLGREAEWRPLGPDPDAEYDDRIELDLDAVGRAGQRHQRLARPRGAGGGGRGRGGRAG